MKFLFIFLPFLHFIIQAAPQDNVSAIDELYAELFSPQNEQVVKERGHAQRLVNALVLEEMIEKEMSQIHELRRMETNAAKIVEKVDSLSENYKKLKAEFHGNLKNEVDIMESDVCKIWEFLVEFRQIKTATLEGNAETIEQTETSTGKCMELDDNIQKIDEKKQGGKATKKKKMEPPSWLALHEWDILFAHFEHLKRTLLLMRRDGRREQPSISCKFGKRLEQFMVDANTGQRVNLGYIFNDLSALRNLFLSLEILTMVGIFSLWTEIEITRPLFYLIIVLVFFLFVLM